MKRNQDHNNIHCIGLLLFMLLLQDNASLSWSLGRPTTTTTTTTTLCYCRGDCAGLLDPSWSCHSCSNSRISTIPSILVVPISITAATCSQRTTRQQFLIHHKTALFNVPPSRKEDAKDDDDVKLGMEEAFRQLEDLKDDLFRNDKEKDNPLLSAQQQRIPTTTTTSNLQVSPELIPEDTPPVPLEKEMKIYKDMVGELEYNEDSEAYLDMIEELDGLGTKQTFDTYSTVLQDLGGTLKGFGKKVDPTLDGVVIPNELSADLLSRSSTERFLESALQDAIKDVKLNHPNLRQDDDILSDDTLKKEIEKIFEAGNEKLLQSIAEIKTEQERLLHQTAAARSSQTKPNPVLEQNAKRLLAAEASMEQVLQKVNRETAQVEQAVADLTAAQAKLEKDFIYQLKQGGLPKQVAFVGIVLFSIRSMVDSVGAVTSNDATMLSAALLQGGIAVAFAVLFAIL